MIGIPHVPRIAEIAGLLLGVGIFGLVALAGAAPISSGQFEAANRFYESGDFQEAAAAYQNLIQQGYVSPALYFNLGNAWFRAGNDGRAIAAYRQAEKLAPGDPDIQANLKFVIARVTNEYPEDIHPAHQRFAGLTLDQWTLAAAGAYWLLMMMQMGRELRPHWRHSWNYIGGGLLGLTALLATVCFLGYRDLNREYAVVVAPTAEVRYGPHEVSETFYRLRDGMEVEVLDHKDAWLQVMDSENRRGWIPSANVVAWQNLEGTLESTAESP